MIMCVKIMIGTKNVGSKLNGSLVNALIEPGSAIPNLPAVAMTKRISSKPNTFQINKTLKPFTPLVEEIKDTKIAVVATAISPKPPGTAKA